MEAWTTTTSISSSPASPSWATPPPTLYHHVVDRGEPVSRDDAALAVGISRPWPPTTSTSSSTTACSRPATNDAATAEGGRRPPGQALRPRRRPARTQPPRPRLRHPGRAARRRRRSRPLRRRPGRPHRAAATLGAELATEAASHPAADANPDQVLAALHQALADRGYEPYDDPDGTIRLRNCPFDRIATHHRELVCGANHAMLQALTDHLDGNPPIQAMLDPQPGRCCVAYAG